MSARFASAKNKKGKKKPGSFKQVAAGQISAAIDATTQDARPVSQFSRPSPAPVGFAPRTAQRTWTPPKASRGQSGLITDYSYVAKDLKRIAITAATMLVIILALSFVIR